MAPPKTRQRQNRRRVDEEARFFSDLDRNSPLGPGQSNSIALMIWKSSRVLALLQDAPDS
jgi:hypothetical protein